MNNKCSYAHIRGVQKWTPFVIFHILQQLNLIYPFSGQ